MYWGNGVLGFLPLEKVYFRDTPFPLGTTKSSGENPNFSSSVEFWYPIPESKWASVPMVNLTSLSQKSPSDLENQEGMNATLIHHNYLSSLTFSSWQRHTSYVTIYVIMTKFTFYLPEQQMESIRELSKQTGLSISELLRRAIDDLLAKYVSDIQSQDNNRQENGSNSQ